MGIHDLKKYPFKAPKVVFWETTEDSEHHRVPCTLPLSVSIDENGEGYFSSWASLLSVHQKANRPSGGLPVGRGWHPWLIPKGYLKLGSWYLQLKCFKCRFKNKVQNPHRIWLRLPGIPCLQHLSESTIREPSNGSKVEWMWGFVNLKTLLRQPLRGWLRSETAGYYRKL